MKEKIKIITYSRVVAMILVTLYHYLYRYDYSYGYQNYNFQFLEPLCFGVAIFFTLTGFLIFYNKTYTKPIKFIIKKYLRLAPCVAVCGIITIIFIFLGGTQFETKMVSFKDYILNLTLVPSYMGSKTIDGAYWTLAIDMFFYLWIFVYICINKKFKIKENIFLYVWLSIAVISNFTMILWENNKILGYINTFSISKYISFFIIGYQLMLIYKDKKMTVWNSIIILLALLNLLFNYNSSYLLCYIIFIIIFIIYGVYKNIEVNKKIENIIEMIANISFVFYLLHQTCGYVIITWLLQFNINVYIICLITFFIIFTISYVVHLFYENKINDIIKKNIGGKC